MVARTLGGRNHRRSIAGVHMQLPRVWSSLLMKKEDVRRGSLIVFVAIALLTIPAFMTGVGAHEKIVNSPGISNTLILRHEGAAELAIWFMEITGMLSVIALWQSAGRARPAGWTTVT